MSQDVSLAALIGRLRAGDEEAVHDLINEYGEPIRRMANVSIRRFRIEKTCDSEDIQTKVLTRIWKPPGRTSATTCSK